MMEGASSIKQKATAFLNEAKLSRRTFVKLGAAITGAIATLPYAASHLLSVSAPRSTEGARGEEKTLSTSCLNCEARCPMQVRVIDGRAVHVFGSPYSLYTLGAICPRAHLSLQMLYDPDRIRGPLKRTSPKKGPGVDPKWVQISWDEALDAVAERLKELRERREPHKLALFQGTSTEADATIMSRFAPAYGTPNLITHHGIGAEADKAGAYLADGHWDYSAYDLEHTNYLLLFGVSLLEAHRPSARLLRIWGMRRGERLNSMKVVVVDPRCSVTAAKADEWIPINPGTDGALALGIAHVILVEGLWDKNFVGHFISPTTRFEGQKTVGQEHFKENWTTGLVDWWNIVLRDFTPEKAEAITGVPARTIKRVAKDLATTEPALALRGRGASAWSNGAYNAWAIHCLNGLVGSIDVPGGVLYQEKVNFKELPDVARDNITEEGLRQPDIELKGTKLFPLAKSVTNRAAKSIATGEPYAIEIAICSHANFVFSAPYPKQWDEALRKVPLFVYISPFMSEMGQYADIFLPTPTFLEKWAYENGVAGAGFAEAAIKQPVVEPLYDTKATIDIVLELARRIGGTVGKSFEGLGDSAEGFVRYRTSTLMPWDEFKEKGVWVGPAYKYYKYDKVFRTPSRKFEFYSGSLKAALEKLGMGDRELERIGIQARGRLLYLPHYEEPRFLGDPNAYPLVLITYKPAQNAQGRSANNPWAQDIYLPLIGVRWTNAAEINPATATKLGIKDGSDVFVESPFGRIKLRAKLSEGMHPDVVGVAYGQGHSAYGRWAKDRGANPNEITGYAFEPYSGMSAYYCTRVRVYRA